MRRPTIPRHEQEVIAAGAKQRNGDVEKIATTSVGSANWRDVDILSRYDKADEVETMLDMVQRLPDDLVCFVASVFCDSKATHSYDVKLRACTAKQAQAIAELFEAACIGRNRGHNGIHLQGVTGKTLVLDPDWDTDD